MKNTAPPEDGITISIEDIVALPKPWAEGLDDQYRLTQNGEMAMSKLLMLHDLVDTEKASVAIDREDWKTFHTVVAEAAGRFIEEHQDHSCVPGMDADCLVVLMAIHKDVCEQRAAIGWHLGMKPC